jgi:circadian clock protein KaiB
MSSPRKGTSISGTPQYVFHLYVAGQSLHTQRAIVNVRNACERHLQGHYELKVVDVLRDPSIAATEQLIALPTLVKKIPAPEVRFIGDLSDAAVFLSRIKI